MLRFEQTAVAFIHLDAFAIVRRVSAGFSASASLGLNPEDIAALAIIATVLWVARLRLDGDGVLTLKPRGGLRAVRSLSIITRSAG